ncbi:MAG: EscU/YscU/HrcU family type III secretion system export apparatus switch protein [Gammaproteobacteria bacterium]|nr:EscU/YscU/HrcU family type III secretion system export apparatus switch protein [Gammaproteobacteria bacterium]
MTEPENPQAVALEYDGKNAPRITATGSGATAQQIIEIAREHGVPLREDPDLLSLLSKLELGDEIPRALYVTVAHVIAWAYVLTGKQPK